MLTVLVRWKTFSGMVFSSRREGEIERGRKGGKKGGNHEKRKEKKKMPSFPCSPSFTTSIPNL